MKEEVVFTTKVKIICEYHQICKDFKKKSHKCLNNGGIYCGIYREFKLIEVS